MSVKCPNKNTTEWRMLKENLGELNAYKVFVSNNNEVPDLGTIKQIVDSYENILNYNLKIAKSLVKLTNVRKTIRTNTKDKPYIEKNITKTLMQNGVPADQIKLMFEYIKENNITEISTEELAIELMSKFGFVIETNVTKKNIIGSQNEYFDENGNQITEKEAKIFKTANTNYYSNLTVPGGTNYTENEISTPDITPNIKGHAKFSTDNGIGWFRSDEQANGLTEMPSDLIKELQATGEYNEATAQYATKIRRILELQSDLFQKLRDKVNENNFLQLLNKNNNWVKFFIQSIVQDSIKKGYEKVLFPTGETAAKIEGHETIADEIIKLDKRISIVNSALNKIKNSTIVENTKYEDIGTDAFDSFNIGEGKFKYNNTTPTLSNITGTKEQLENRLKKEKSEQEKEIIRLKAKKQELKTQGLEKLKPVEAFYTNTVTNILKKLYDVKVITDEHGNTWNEIDLTKVNNKNEILFSLNDGKKAKGKSKKVETLIEKLTPFFVKHGISLNAIDNLQKKYGVDAVAAANMVTNTIDYLNNQKGLEAIPEEIGHFAVEILGVEHPYVKRALELVKDHPRYQEVYDEYFAIYDNELDVKKEVLGKLLGESLLDKTNDKSNLSTMLKAIWNAMKKFANKLVGNNYQSELDSIIDSMSDMIFDNSMDVNNNKTGVFYNKASNLGKDVKILEKALSALYSRLSRLENLKGISSEARGKSIKKTTFIIKKAIEDNSIELGLKSFITEFSKEIGVLYNEKNTGALQNKQVVMDGTRTTNAINFINNYDNLIRKMLGVFESPSFNEKYINEYNTLKELSATFEKIKRIINDIVEDNAEDIIRNQSKSGDVDGLLAHIQQDVSGWRAFVGSPRHAGNELIRIATDIIDTARIRVKMHSNQYASQLMEARKKFKEAGLKELDLFEMHDGKLTGNIISKHNKHLVNEKVNEVKEDLMLEFGIEDYNDITYETLDREQKKIFKRKWKQFFDEHTLPNDDSTPTDNYLNDTFAKFEKNEAFLNYYNLIIEQRKRDFKKIPKRYDTRNNLYKVPQIRKNLIDVYKRKGEGAKGLFTDIFKKVEDDTEFGQVITDSDGNEIRLIPVHYFNPVETNDLSTDIASMSIAFTEMAENYRQMSLASGDVNMLRETVKTQQFQTRGGRRSREGASSNTLKTIDNVLDGIVYGISSEKIIINGYDVTKAISSFNSYIRKTNLGLSPFTALSGYGKSSIDSKTEDIEGVYSTQKSKLFAEAEYLKNAPQALLQVNKGYQTNKMQLAFETLDLFGNAIRRYRNLNANRFERFVLSDDFWYSPYMIVDHRVKGKLAISVMDNFRYVDGKWMFKYEFKQAGLQGDWSTYPTYYNSMNVNKNTIVHDSIVTEETKIKMYKTISHLSDKIDGKIGDMDRSAAHRNGLAQIILTHRGWLVSGIDARGKSKGINYSTGIEEEGYYRTVAKLVQRMSTHMYDKIKKQEVNLDKMTSLEKRALARTVADLGFLTLLWGLSSLLYAHWADDDDYTKDFIVYILHRVQLEQIAFLNPTEALNLIKSPVAATNQMNYFSTVIGSLMPWSESKEVSRGVYKGYSTRERALIKLIPGLRQVWAVQDPEAKTNYLRASFFN